MDLNRDETASGPIVTGFSGRGFRIRETVFPGGLLLTPESAMPWDDVPAVAAMTAAALGDLLTLTPVPEFLLLGTGAGLIQPPRAFVRAMEAIGIGVDAMDSRAAARAWGVLRAEQRWIAAALMPL
jgi:uncharacterized protein